MTAFRPGDLAVVTGDDSLWDHQFPTGTVVELLYAVSHPDDGYACRWHSGPEGAGMLNDWDVAEADLARVESPADPAPSPLAALIEAAHAALRAIDEGRVSIEQEWQDPNHTTYRIVVAPEEKS